MDHEGIMISENGSSPDGQEGMLAFAEKRKPNFSGKWSYERKISDKY